eukprot:2456918-Rhodomonas_salina.2
MDHCTRGCRLGVADVHSVSNPNNCDYGRPVTLKFPMPYFECERLGCEDGVLLAELSGPEHTGDMFTTQTVCFMKVELEYDANLHMGGFDAAWTSVSTCELGRENSGGLCVECANPEQIPSQSTLYPGDGCESESATVFRVYLSEEACRSESCPATMSLAAGASRQQTAMCAGWGSQGRMGGRAWLARPAPARTRRARERASPARTRSRCHRGPGSAGPRPWTASAPTASRARRLHSVGVLGVGRGGSGGCVWRGAVRVVGGQARL